MRFEAGDNVVSGNILLEVNYWSDYPGVDEFSGPNQDEAGSDGIGDTSYGIDENNMDNYPLFGMFSDFSATSEHHVQTICNSTISGFQFNGTAILFNVTGEDGTTGFCSVHSSRVDLSSVQCDNQRDEKSLGTIL